MPRLILTTGAGASTADIRTSAMQVASVQDAVSARQANAVIVSVPELTSSVRQELTNLPGVTGVHEDLQGIPLVADERDVQDFLNKVGDLRGRENVPPLFEVEPNRPGEPMTDGGAVVLPVPSAQGSEAAQPTGPLRDADDSLADIGVTELHEQGMLGQGVISVVIDTGSCDSAIQEDRKLEGADLSGQDNPYSLLADHGGMSMGIMAGDDTTPGLSVGVLPESDVFPIKTTLAASELIQAQDIIATLADQNDEPVVVNNSWGFPECTGICDHPVTQAISNTADHPNVVQVFAAGNSAAGITGCGQACDGSTPGISGPNSLTNVITVAASGRNGEPPTMQDYSSRGGPDEVACGQRKPDVTAPVFGVMPWGCGEKDMGNTGGTSAACPQVAGVVGLIAQSTGSTDVEQIRSILVDSADDIDPSDFDGCSGGGLVNAPAATEAGPVEAPSAGGFSGKKAVPVVGSLVAAGILGAALRERGS